MVGKSFFGVWQEVGLQFRGELVEEGGGEVDVWGEGGGWSCGTFGGE